MRRPILALSTCVMSASLLATGPVRAGDWVEMGALPAPDYRAAGAGVLRLLCVREGEGGTHVSRAVLIDAGEGGRAASRGYDILLASRHAVADAEGPRDCTLQGMGEAGEIVRIHAPDSAPGAFAEDWAILVTAARLSPGMTRLRAAAPPPGLEGDVSLVVRAAEERACRLGPGPAEVAGDHLLFHDCETRPGLSGSPLVSRVGDQVFVIGLHLGWVQVWRDDAPRQGVARRLTADLGAVLASVIAEENARRLR